MTRPVAVQQKHSAWLALAFVTGAAARSYVPILFEAFRIPAFTPPTRSDVVLYIVAWMILATAWILGVFALGWWWGPFDAAWRVPFPREHAPEEVRASRTLLVILAVYVCLSIGSLVAIGLWRPPGLVFVLALVVFEGWAGEMIRKRIGGAVLRAPVGPSDPG